MEANRPLPCSEEAERIVLSAIMSEKNALPEIREILSIDAFYFPKHQEIYKACLAVSDRGDFPDIVSVMNELNKSKSEVEVSPYELAYMTSGYNPFYMQEAAHVFDNYKRRQFFEIGCYLNQNCFSMEYDIVDVIDKAKEMIEGLFREGTSEVFTMKDAVQGVYDNINRNMSGGGGLTGYPTGFSDFDRKSGGLQTSDLIIIAADTSAGKSSLAIKLAMNAGCPIAFYSLEMKKEQIAARMIAIESGVPANEILYSRLDSGKLSQLDKGVARIMDKPIYFDDKSTSGIEGILASIRMMKIKYGIKGVVLDYLQILNVNMKGSNKEQQMGEVARKLKNIAKDLDIFVIALSQLSRDRDNPVPSMARLRDSGQIAEAADTVMLIYRPEVYGKNYPDPFTTTNPKDTAMIDIAKGRNIGIMKFIVGFDAKTTNFHELNEIPFAPKEDTPF